MSIAKSHRARRLRVAVRSRAERLPGRERRGQIVEVAIALLARDGARGLTTSALAAAAGISEAALFKHFPSMEAVLDAALQLQAERMMDLIEAFDPGEARGWTAVAALIRHLLRFLEDAHGGPLLMLVVGPVSPDVREKAERSMQRLSERVAEVAAPANQTAAMTPLASAVVQSAVLRSLLGEARQSPTELAEPMLRFLDSAFAAKNGHRRK